MKKIHQWLLVLAGCTFALSASLAAEQAAGQAGVIKMGVVNTKKCLEDSKLGKQVQANFEKMKKQMETILQEKERDLEEIEAKLNDDDYMDSISEDAASELKRKKRNLRAEGMQLQSQYMQTLQQANMKIVQELTEAISKASKQVAQDEAYDAIFSDEALTFYKDTLDMTNKVVAQMNAHFDKEQKDGPVKK